MSRCQHENRPQAKFCEECAGPLNAASPTARSYADLKAEAERLGERWPSPLEQQTATSEILRVISSSPTDLQPVFDAVADNAARLCEAPDVIILRVDGDALRRVASVGPFAETIRPDQQFPMVRGSVVGRAIVDRRTLHIRDLASESDDEFPVGKDLQRRYGHRTMLAVPLLREDMPLGVIAVVRTEVEALLRRAGFAPRDLRRPGGHRDRERPPVHRAAGEEPSAYGSPCSGDRVA